MVLSIVAGLILGRASPATATAVRPLGVLFLNFIFMIIVPLVFFTVASSIASATSGGRLSRISLWMLAVFLFTSLVAAVGALLFMLLVHPTPGAGIQLRAPQMEPTGALLDQLVGAVSVSDFADLLSHRSMLPLIVLAIAVGVATRQLGDRAAAFAQFLAGGAQVFTRLVTYVMYLAPVGVTAYFAVVVADTGAQLATAYLRVLAVYYAFAAVYFFGGFSLYALAAGGRRAVVRFWSWMAKPSLTAIGTCSSMATLPANLEAAPRMGAAPDVCDVTIPLGAALHKDGSVIGGVLKVLFAMSMFQQELTPGRLAATVGVAILVGVVMGAIPSGGMTGELLILSVFGFPPEALPLLAVISVIIDPGATLINATGDNVAAMMITRVTEGDVWTERAQAGPLDQAA